MSSPPSRLRLHAYAVAAWLALATAAALAWSACSPSAFGFEPGARFVWLLCLAPAVLAITVTTFVVAVAPRARVGVVHGVVAAVWLVTAAATLR